MSDVQNAANLAFKLSSVTTKQKSEKYLKYRRKRQLKRKRKLLNKSRNKQMAMKNQSPNPHASHSLSVDNRTMNIAVNHWAESHALAVTWQYKHQIAYWKSKAEALHYENKVLHSIIENIYGKPSQQEASISGLMGQQFMANDKGLAEDRESDSDSELVLSEDMLNFLQKSAEHKLSRDKQKMDIQDSEAATAPPPKVSFDESREEEWKLLYGKSSNKIIGLETAIQLNFDNYMDVNKPVFWPNIPLNLNCS